MYIKIVNMKHRGDIAKALKAKGETPNTGCWEWDHAGLVDEVEIFEADAFSITPIDHTAPDPERPKMLLTLYEEEGRRNERKILHSLTVIQQDTEIYVMNDQGVTIDRYRWASTIEHLYECA